MKNSAFLFLLTCLLSCNTISEEHLTFLNGYWEIELVEFPNGGKKEYKINETVDFIQLDGSKGYRKKVVPRFDGNFETSDDAEPFSIEKNEDAFILSYKNNLSAWQETLTALSEDAFTIRNADGVLYHYKRFEPISITP